jgi:hypothetical protein
MAARATDRELRANDGVLAAPVDRPVVREESATLHAAIVENR